MKKKIVFVISIIALCAMLIGTLCACNVTGTLELDSYPANSEAFTKCTTQVVNENSFNVTVDRNYNKDLLWSGTDFERFEFITLYFDKSKVVGQEFGCVQFTIEADRDVTGTFGVLYFADGTAIECFKKYQYSLVANTPTTFTIDFNKNFIIANSHNDAEITLDFNSPDGMNFGSYEYLAYKQTQYKISKLEFGVN